MSQPRAGDLTIESRYVLSPRERALICEGLQRLCGAGMVSGYALIPGQNEAHWSEIQALKQRVEPTEVA